MLGRVASAIDDLANDPHQTDCKKLKSVEDTYRIRIGDYRVLYTVDDSIVTVEVVKIGDRKDIYE
ncbi:type II toxin-antitoxin system RelE family toxin [Spirosoma koreense]